MSPQQQLHNLVLDFLYRHICLGKTNQEIFREMEQRAQVLPPMSETELNKVRADFKEREQMFPEKMQEFRRRLKV